MRAYSYGRQTIDEADVAAVVDVLRSDWLTQGPMIPKFEEGLAGKFGSRYAAAVSNGTAGLHLIALALGWREGDIILTSPITFVASANSALYVGATPDFVDIDPQNYTIDINKLEDKLRAYVAQGKNVKAVVAVDFAGSPCDWEGLTVLREKYNLQLVNDFCHALGAEYNGDAQYAARFADAVNLSFHPVKHITTGEGGAVLTNDRELDAKVKLLRTHGITKDFRQLERNEGPWYYEMQQLGFNYRITDLQCALGISQLAKLDAFVRRRREIASFYDKVFSGDLRMIVPETSPARGHSYHLYPLQIKFDTLSVSKGDYFSELKKRNINCQVHYIPVHLQPFYRKRFGFKKGDFPVAEQFYQREVSIPIYPGLNDEDVKYISNEIKVCLAGR